MNQSWAYMLPVTSYHKENDVSDSPTFSDAKVMGRFIHQQPCVSIIVEFPIKYIPTALQDPLMIIF